VFVNTFYAKKI